MIITLYLILFSFIPLIVIVHPVQFDLVEEQVWYIEWLRAEAAPVEEVTEEGMLLEVVMVKDILLEVEPVRGMQGEGSAEFLLNLDVDLLLKQIFFVEYNCKLMQSKL